MHNDESFLRAITDNRTDDSIRRAYGEWLEKHGDPRAEFLRVQDSLAQSSASARYRRLCEREQELVTEVDPFWVQRVRRYTTAPPCRDLALLIPELRPFGCVTARLHPHRAAGRLPERISKIGGRFLWPTSEEWPSCSKCGLHLVPVLQLRKRDVPDMKFPVGADLMQLFWCANEEAHDYQPEPRIWWRAEDAIKSVRTDEPDLSSFPEPSHWGDGYVPFECAVYPERVIEYPSGDDLNELAGAELAARIAQLIENMNIDPIDDMVERFASQYGPSGPGDLAFYELGQCPGSKVGGNPGFKRGGLQYDHLATLASWEFDSASFRRWLAVEDQRLLAPPGELLTWRRLFRESDFRPLQVASGMQFGRTQRAHIYICRDRDPWDCVAFVND